MERFFASLRMTSPPNLPHAPHRGGDLRIFLEKHDLHEQAQIGKVEAFEGLLVRKHFPL